MGGIKSFFEAGDFHLLGVGLLGVAVSVPVAWGELPIAQKPWLLASIRLHFV